MTFVPFMTCITPILGLVLGPALSVPTRAMSNWRENQQMIAGKGFCQWRTPNLLHRSH